MPLGPALGGCPGRSGFLTLGCWGRVQKPLPCQSPLLERQLLATDTTVARAPGLGLNLDYALPG